MARVTINMPESYTFTTEMPIRMSDTNGGHLSNYSALILLQEARLLFLADQGYNEDNIIISDNAVIYKSEGFYGDQLKFEICAEDFNKYGCDIFYKISNAKTGADIMHAKTGILFYDYKAEKVQHIPEDFLNRFKQ